ncbi:lipase family protein [Alginatibacterium sediminis]|nr:lipase family protein [Alginatibacterium sediminis]
MKNIPSVLQKNLLPPDMDYHYFEGSKAKPFDTHSNCFSLSNALWLSECSLLAYAHPGFARLAYKLEGLHEFKFFQGVGTECMIAWNDDLMIVSFRGTELTSLSTLYELATDLNAIPCQFEKGGRVHQGFNSALAEIWLGEDGLEVFFATHIAQNPKRRIWITGHSLGGALATLCFAHIEHAQGLYIYGSPRVGDAQFNSLLDKRVAWRVEHKRDPIPFVPPNLPAINLGYEDTGELVFLGDAQLLMHQRPEKSAQHYKELALSTLAEQEKQRKELPIQFQAINDHLGNALAQWRDTLKQVHGDTSYSMSDHMPIFYCSKLWNLLFGDATNQDDTK